MRKVCRKCGKRKAASQFYKNYTACKSCVSEWQRKWNAKNPDKAARYQRNYRARNREKVAAYNREWRRKNREHYNAYRNAWRKKNRIRYLEQRKWVRLKSAYGLSKEEYLELLDRQKGGCAICKTKPGSKLLAVDHCHRSGKVRGLLCSNCNTGLGLLGDSKRLLAKALSYLRSRR